MNISGSEKHLYGGPPPLAYDQSIIAGFFDEESTEPFKRLPEVNCRYRDPQGLADVGTVTITASSACTMAASLYQALPRQIITPSHAYITDESNAYSLIIEPKAAPKTLKTKEHDAIVDPLYVTLESLSETWRECSIENWDGYGAQSISHDTYMEAIILLTLIPPSVPMPEVVPEPAGEIAFEWYKGKGRVFVVSVGGRNVIKYAGLFGENNKAHGTESFHNGELPKTIIDNIRRVFDQ